MGGLKLFCKTCQSGGEQVWQLPPGATCSRQGNAPGGYNMYGQGGMGQQMWGGQQMPYGYQQSWYWACNVEVKNCK